MTEQKKSLVQDVLGSLLFVVGAFLAFSVSMYLFEGGARQDSNLSTRIVLAVVDTTGAVMGLAFGLLLAALGAGFFFLQHPVSIVRHGGGALAVFLGLTLVVGSISTGSAGSLGDLFTNLSGNSTVGAIAGIPVGLMIVLITVWLAWLPEAVRIPAKLGEANPVSAALREGDEGGVTSAEAAALLPVDENEEPVVPAHPIDVRLQGGVPEGTLPIETDRATEPDPLHGRAPSPSPTEAATGGVAAPLGGDGRDRADEDLAPAASAVAPAAVEPAPDDSVRPIASAPAELVSPEVSGAEDVPVTRDDEEPGLLRASWETEAEPVSVVEPETLPVVEPAEKTVAATVVEEERPAGVAPAEFTVTDEPEFDWEAEEDARAAAAPSAETAGAETAETAEEEASSEDVDEEPAVAKRADDDVADEEADESDEPEEAEESEDDEEWEYEEVEEEIDEDDPEAAYEEWEDEVEDDESEDESEDEDGEEEYDEEEYEDEDGDEEEVDEDEEYEDDGDDEEYEDEDGEEEYEDDDEEDDEEYEDDEDDEDDEEEQSAELEEEAEPEPEVVVTPAPKRGRKEPAAAGKASAAPKASGKRGKAGAAAAAGSDDERIHRAGLLLLDAGRVAVSMLQREFDVDFQEATRILDELQARGLIGPYLGGRRRDILLTREEWEAQAPTT